MGMLNITKEQVIKKLSKSLNPKDVQELVAKNFDYATRKYSTLKSVCECIVTLH